MAEFLALPANRERFYWLPSVSALGAAFTEFRHEGWVSLKPSITTQVTQVMYMCAILYVYNYAPSVAPCACMSA